MNRAGIVLTHKLLNNYVICVPESQYEDYLQYHPAEHLVTHPDTVIGLTAKWQWMLDNLMDDEALFFLDDDISHVIRTSSYSDDHDKRVKDPETVEGIIQQLVDTAKGINSVFFGINTMPHSIQFMTGFEPFRVIGYINGAAMGFLKNHNLRFNTEFWLKGDWWMTLLNLYKNRYGIVDYRYAFAQEGTFVREGGQTAYRSTDREREEIKMLRRYFGDVIKTGLKKSRSRKTDYAGIDSTSIACPWR